MRFVGTCYRAHDPQWAFDPLSGAGAAIHGARFNPAGTPALYLALSLEGMFAEMGHGFARRLQPLTVCSYDVDIDGIADLRDEAGRDRVGVDLDTLGCAWANDRAERRKPASWKFAERMIKSGATGILVPSFAVGALPDMMNLVLWKWGPDLPCRVTVHDPDSRLPRDRSSWLPPAPPDSEPEPQ